MKLFTSHCFEIAYVIFYFSSMFLLIKAELMFYGFKKKFFENILWKKKKYNTLRAGMAITIQCKNDQPI